MSNIRVRWSLPTEREPVVEGIPGAPLPIEEIAGVRLAFKVEGAPDFTPIPGPDGAPLFPPTVLEKVLFDVNPGATYIFEGVVVDTAGRTSKPMIGSRNVPVPVGPPNPLETFEVILE